MPNWCNNSITIRHVDPQMIERAYQALCQGQFLNEFVPMPKELLEGDGWYQWAVNNWGTKWDVGGNDCMVEKANDNEISASFDSAWAPPCAAYEKLAAMGFIIKAYYHEPGMCFAGVWTGDEDYVNDDYREYSDESAETVREAVGEELDDYWGISESMASWEDDREDQ